MGWGGECHSKQSSFKGEEILEKFEGWRYCISFRQSSMHILSQLFIDYKLHKDRNYICCVHTSTGLLAQHRLLLFSRIKIGLHWVWNYICWLSLKVEKVVVLYRKTSGYSGGTWKVPLPWQLRAGLVLRNLISLPYLLVIENRTGRQKQHLLVLTCTPVNGKRKCEAVECFPLGSTLPCFRRSQARIRVVAYDLLWSGPRKWVSQAHDQDIPCLLLG